jgi:molecular chaperone DnaK (HSP70)
MHYSQTHFLGKLFKRHAYIRASSILQYGIRQPPLNSRSKSHNTPFLALTRKIHRLLFSVGIESPHGLFILLIRSSTQIPIEASEIFARTLGLATREEIRIFQGNNALARNNIKLGGLHLIFTQAQHLAEVSLTFSIREAFTLHVSAYNTASPLLTYTTSLHTDLYFERNGSIQRHDEDEEVCFIKAKEHAENTLQIVKTALIDKKETLNKIPLISSYFNELEAALQTNDFAASLTIHNRTLILKNAIIYHFECTYYSYRRSFTGKAIFANLDSQLPLF